MGRRARERGRSGGREPGSTPSTAPEGARANRKGAKGPATTTRRPRQGRSPARWVGWLAVIALAAVAFRALPASGGVARVGEPAPSLKVKTLDGEKLSLADLKGKVVLVNFWATWCPPCRAEMPGFEQVWRERQKDGFVVLGLSADDGGSGAVAAFLGERGVTYPVGMASAAAKRSFGGVNALPSSFLIDKQGRVRREVEGAFDERLLRQEVNRLLAE